MHALRAIRTTPVRAAARLHSVQAGDSQAGMTTAEYAVGTIAASGFAGILYKILTSDWIVELLKSLISKAFNFSF